MGACLIIVLKTAKVLLERWLDSYCFVPYLVLCCILSSTKFAKQNCYLVKLSCSCIVCVLFYRSLIIIMVYTFSFIKEIITF